VTIDIANPLKHKGMKRTFKAGDVLELAYADAHLLLASKVYIHMYAIYVCCMRIHMCPNTTIFRG
jgi:hypothetical protein